MTLTEAAAILNVTRDTLRQQIHAGKLQAEKVGRDWHVTSKEVERYRTEHRRAPVIAAVSPLRVAPMGVAMAQAERDRLLGKINRKGAKE